MTNLRSEARPTGKVAIAGQGYVGLPIAMRAVEVGYDVVGYEPDLTRAKRLLSCSSYVEDVSDTVLSAALASGRYEPSDAIEACEGFDVAVITVPTSPRVLPICPTSNVRLGSWPRTCARARRSSSSRPRTQVPPRSSSCRSSKQVPDWSRVETSASALS